MYVMHVYTQHSYSYIIFKNIIISILTSYIITSNILSFFTLFLSCMYTAFSNEGGRVTNGYSSPLKVKRLNL